ncbi:hypothetical protein Csa_023763, partial [Cucumis sativus]
VWPHAFLVHLTCRTPWSSYHFTHVLTQQNATSHGHDLVHGLSAYLMAHDCALVMLHANTWAKITSLTYQRSLNKPFMS